MFQPTQQLDAESAKYWADNAFSVGLIKANATLVPQGYSMRMSLPTKDNKDPLNIAELLMPDGTQLGVYLIQNYGYAFNPTAKIDRKLANWLNLVHILLDNSVCYFEAPGAKFRTKLIVTRNLYLANALISKPIANFDLFYRILDSDTAYYDTLAINQPALAETARLAKEAMINLKGTTSQQKAAVEWLSQVFSCEIALVKSFIQAYDMVNQDKITNCVQGKCGLIKLKYTNGVIDMPTRIQAATAIPMSSIFLPLDFMRKQARVLLNALKTNIVFARYLRDNNITRDIVASHNQGILTQLYGAQIAKDFAEPKYFEDRGYISCVDLCNSKIGGDLTRAISLARLQGITFLQPDVSVLPSCGWHPSFPDTDFNMVIPEFKKYIAQMRGNMPFLCHIYCLVTQQAAAPATFTSPYQVEESLYSYVDMQANLTSSFVRKLHLLMLDNPVIFQGYTGKPQDLGNLSVSSTPKFATLGTL